MDYYDIDDIIADSQRLPVKFQATVPGLGYLDGNPGKPLIKGTKLELPMWLAQVLVLCPTDTEDEVTGEVTNFIEMLKPEFIGTKVQNAIKSNPNSIDLHSILPFFYNFIIKWCWLFDDASLVQMCLDMLRERSSEINNLSSNSAALNNLENFNKLDEFEKKLFKANHQTVRDFRKWMVSSAESSSS